MRNGIRKAVALLLSVVMCLSTAGITMAAETGANQPAILDQAEISESSVTTTTPAAITLDKTTETDDQTALPDSSDTAPAVTNPESLADDSELSAGEEQPMTAKIWSGSETPEEVEISQSDLEVLQQIERSQSSGCRRARARVTYPSYTEAREIILATKSEYPEGMEWTNFKPYGKDGTLGAAYWFRGGAIKGARGGVGCMGIGLKWSDGAFGDIPASVYDAGDFTYDDIKVGDILRMGGHAVIVLWKAEGGVIVAEGNYNGSIHWNRAISQPEVAPKTKAEVMSQTSFVITRYPRDFVSPDAETADEVVKSGTEGNLNWTLTNGGVLMISGSDVIPDYDISNRPAWEAADCPAITSINIGEGVTRIGNYAFYCTSALNVLIPNTVKTIGDSAFRGQSTSSGQTPVTEATDEKKTTSLVSITIPSSVESVGNNAFADCANLTSVSTTEGLKTVGDGAFQGCTSLQYIDFPASITQIGEGAFSSCQSILSVRFAPGTNGVSIGNNPFTKCWNLRVVVLPEKLDKISNGMFAGCNMLTYLCIPAGVSQIYEHGGIGGAPFAQTAISRIDFCGTEAEWNAKGGKQAVQQTNGGGANITVNFNQPFNNPFAPIEGDPGDLVMDEENPPTDEDPCKDGHKGVADADGNCTVCGKPFTTENPVEPPAEETCQDGKHVGTDDGTGHCTKCGALLKPEGTEKPDEPTNPTPSQHQHAWSADWSHDTTHHWHECSNADCSAKNNEQKDGYSEHIYSDWIIDVAATGTTDGNKHRACTVCGYRDSVIIPATGELTDSSGGNSGNSGNSGNGSSGSSGSGSSSGISGGSSGSGSGGSGGSSGGSSYYPPSSSEGTSSNNPSNGSNNSAQKPQPDQNPPTDNANSNQSSGEPDTAPSEGNSTVTPTLDDTTVDESRHSSTRIAKAKQQLRVKTKQHLKVNLEQQLDTKLAAKLKKELKKSANSMSKKQLKAKLKVKLQKQLKATVKQAAKAKLKQRLRRQFGAALGDQYGEAFNRQFNSLFNKEYKSQFDKAFEKHFSKLYKKYKK